MNNLYLDFDGVINAFSDRAPTQNTGWKGEWREERIDDFRVFWSVELVDRLLELAARPGVNMVFASDWRSKGLELLDPVFGAAKDHWDVLEASDARLEAIAPWWKMEEIEKHIAETNPEHSIWVDDNLTYAPGIDVWRRRQPNGFATINPNTHHGLTRKQMQMIEDTLT